MAEIVNMPKLGFDMAEGTLVRWVVAEGGEVKKGQVLAEIETDKATVEVESNFEGVVLQHLVQQGTPVPVGDPIAVIGQAGEQVDAKALAGQAAPEAETGLRPEAEVRDQQAQPRESATEAARQEPGQGLPGEAQQVPTSETGLKLGAPIEDQQAQPRDSALEEAKPPVKDEAVEALQEAEPGDGRLPGGLRASPLARRMAEEKGIDLQRVKGSGPQGRITRKDVETFAAQPQAAPAPAAAPAAAPAGAAAPAPAAQKPAAPAPAFAPVGPPPPDETISLNRLRAAIGRRMAESKQQVPHFYVTHEYDMGPVMDLRKQVNALMPEGEKISVNDFIVKATGLALRQFPNLNASLKGNEIVRHGAVNVGVAVAVEGGLLTVVCRDADRKGLRQIASEVRTMAGRARQGKVKPEEIEGSTFSISNLGMFDVEDFIAIINPPEAAILAVGSAREVPVVVNGEIKPGWRMKATISVDHRVSDGAEAAQFLQALAPYLEEPMRLLL